MHFPLVFVHGNGDSAALWLTQFWRFESNGWPRALLHAIDFARPVARDDDTVPQAGRSGSAEQVEALAEFVTRVLEATGADRVGLIASSRGANAVRGYALDARRRRTVAAAILAGGVNHGVWSLPGVRPGAEFNGAGPVLRALNAPRPDGSEVPSGIRWLTLRSNGNDKYAQPDGRYAGMPGMATGVGFDGPALRGADNVVLPGADHREVAFGEAAFAAMYRFLTGTAPTCLEIVAEPAVTLAGNVTGYLGVDPTNLPLPGARLAVHRIDAGTGNRAPTSVWSGVIGADGCWGPCTVPHGTPLEFELAAQGCPVTHLYRAPFARSSSIVHLRPAIPGTLTQADLAAGGGVVAISRPRGYFGVGRDRFDADGRVPPGIPAGVPCISFARIIVPGPPRAVVTHFADERIVVRTWPAAADSIAIAEFHG